MSATEKNEVNFIATLEKDSIIPIVQWPEVEANVPALTIEYSQDPHQDISTKHLFSVDMLNPCSLSVAKIQTTFDNSNPTRLLDSHPSLLTAQKSISSSETSQKVISKILTGLSMLLIL